jgi:DNA sulfur modification protein DndD
VRLQRFVIRDVGAYAGENVFDLSAKPGRPIILIGGMNGGGKTTFLEGMQLVLFGARAKLTGRGNSYEDFLRSLIHRGQNAEGSSLELTFTHREEGVDHEYALRRSWTARNERIKESLTVRKNGQPDNVLAEAWDDYIESILPLGLSTLFLFDGEKVEAFADLDNARGLLNTGLSALLGLELIDRLERDLFSFERKKATGLRSESSTSDLSVLSERIDALRVERANAVQTRAHLQNDADRAMKLLREKRSAYATVGGEFFEQREELEKARETHRKDLDRAEEHLRDLAATDAPLLLLLPFLHELQEIGHQQQEEALTSALKSFIDARDKRLLKQLQKQKTPTTVLSRIEDFLHRDQPPDAGNVAPVKLSEEARESINRVLANQPSLARQIEDGVNHVDRLEERLTDVERKLAGVPDAATVSTIRAEVDAAAREAERTRIALEDASDELSRVDRQVVESEQRLSTLMSRAAEERFEHDENARVLLHADRTRATLKQYRGALLRRHIARIEHVVTDSLRQLLRKESLVERVQIDPDTLNVSLIQAGGRVLEPERLSAGERQLLAIALLWGLGRASGRPLPTVIDTPLGRLDGVHREHLLTRYFPAASHQVILLSTDTEVDRAAYELMAPKIARSYVLAFDDTQGATSVVPGYFWN